MAHDYQTAEEHIHGVQLQRRDAIVSTWDITAKARGSISHGAQPLRRPHLASNICPNLPFWGIRH
jgi:hypothetical protein